MDGLGLDWEAMPFVTVESAFGDVQVRFADVTVRVADGMAFSVYTGFCREWDGRDYGVLGFHGFLETLKATFDPVNGMFSLDVP
jgi:hypothetical protein